MNPKTKAKFILGSFGLLFAVLAITFVGRLVSDSVDCVHDSFVIAGDPNAAPAASCENVPGR